MQHKFIRKYTRAFLRYFLDYARDAFPEMGVIRYVCLDEVYKNKNECLRMVAIYENTIQE